MAASHLQVRTLLLATLALAAANLLSVLLVHEFPRHTPPWLGTAVLVGLLLRAPRRRWPHLLAAFAAASTLVHAVVGDSWLAIFGAAAIGLGEAWIVASTLHPDRAWVDGTSDRPEAWLRFLVIGVALAPAFAGVLGALVVMIDRGEPFAAAYRNFFAAHAVATCVVVPVILRLRRGQWTRLRRAGPPRKITMNDEIYRSIAVDSGAMILVGDELGRNEYVSPATSELLGVPASEMRGLAWQRFVHPGDVHLLMDAVARLRAGATEAVCLFRFRVNGGEYRWMETRCRKSRPRNPNARGRIIWMARDITAHRLKESELEAQKLALEEMAGTDALTGMHNRRRFDDARRREWQQACSEATPISMLIVDVDHFKRFNDTYGHAAGDRCLVAIAAAIAATMRRSTDFCARLGGEEFVVILPATDNPGARHVAEEIRRSVADLAIAHRSSDEGFVTVSVGIATCDWPEAGKDEALFEEADNRLYRAKAEGRNRIAARP